VRLRITRRRCSRRPSPGRHGLHARCPSRKVRLYPNPQLWQNATSVCHRALLVRPCSSPVRLLNRSPCFAASSRSIPAHLPRQVNGPSLWAEARCASRSGGRRHRDRIARSSLACARCGWCASTRSAPPRRCTGAAAGVVASDPHGYRKAAILRRRVTPPWPCPFGGRDQRSRVPLLASSRARRRARRQPRRDG
jgi:hypothetical protein